MGLRNDVPIGVVRTNIVIRIEDFNNYTLNVPVVSQVRGDYNIKSCIALLWKGECRYNYDQGMCHNTFQ